MEHSTSGASASAAAPLDGNRSAGSIWRLVSHKHQKPSAVGELLSGQASPQHEPSKALLRGTVLLWGWTLCHSSGWTLRFLLPRVRAPCSAYSGGITARAVRQPPRCWCAGGRMGFVFVGHIQPWGPSELLTTVHPTQGKHAWCCQTAGMSKIKLVRNVV